MPTIDQLSTTPTVSAGDKVPVFVQGNGDARAATMSVLLDFVEANFASPDYVTQIFAPSSSGTTIQFVPQAANLWAIINPTGAFAALTLVLPSPVGEVFADGAQILVTCSNSVDVLTINGNGATVFGAPTALGVGGFFTLRYNKLQTRWYCTSQSLGGIGSVFASISFNTEPATFFDINGRPALQLVRNYVSPGTGATNYVLIVNDDAGGTPQIQAASTDGAANVNLGISAEGTGELALDGGSTGSARLAGFTGVQVSSSSGTIDISGVGVDIVGGLGVNINGQKLDLGCPVDFAGGGFLYRGLTFAQLASLVTALGNIDGIRARCTDSNTAVFNATVAGGGANKVNVTYDGTNWKVG